MLDQKWSQAEKKIARRAYESALKAELAEVLADFKARAAAATDTDDMWAIQEYLHRKGREIDQKYDYRYSQLSWAFARLIREGRIEEAELAGLAQDKLDIIRRMVSL
jgi:hypothetical protein